LITNGETQHWETQAKCKTPEVFGKYDFFTTDTEEKNEIKNICFTCPVRADCVKFALENGEIWGIWGGKDENEIRRTLSVNAEGLEVRRGRYPQCPYCGARTSKLMTKTIDLPDGGRWTTGKMVECTNCGFDWRSRSSANAVVAYHAERANVEARAARRQADLTAKELAAATTDVKIAEAVVEAATALYDEERAKTPKNEDNPKIEEAQLVLKQAKKDHRLARGMVVRLTQKSKDAQQQATELLDYAKSNPTKPKNY
jgi:WhiB family redox-sensing transcriptional regulator